MRRLTALAALMLLALFALGACSGDDGDTADDGTTATTEEAGSVEDEEDGDGAGDGQASAEFPTECLEADAVTGIVGVTVTEPSANTENGLSCHYTEDGGTGFVTVTIGPDGDLAFVAVPEDAEQVSGLGEKATYADASGLTVLLSGNRFLSVVIAGGLAVDDEQAASVEIAEAVIAEL